MYTTAVAVAVKIAREYAIKESSGRAMKSYHFKDGMIGEETGMPDIFGIMLQIRWGEPLGA